MPKKKVVLKKSSEPVLDFSLDKELSDEEKKRIAIVLASGLRGEFWKILAHMLEKKIEESEELILDPDNQLTPEQREKWVRWHSYLVFLGNMPSELIQSLVVDQPLPMPDDEVYE